jgi:type II secretion system protein I
MVALTIVALSLTAVAASMNQMIDAANAMRERTYASWIAQNKITEMRLANTVPEVSVVACGRIRNRYREFHARRCFHHPRGK